MKTTMEAEPRLNRTGIAMSPELSQELIDIALKTKPSAPGDERGVAMVRNAYEQTASPIGTLPPDINGSDEPDDLEDAAVPVLIDKLGERLAFERTGVRLYQALVAKLEASGPAPGGPSREELLHIQDEELAHFELVKSAIESMGGDPTVVTPAADVTGVVSCGIPQVLVDPRTTMLQALDAVLVAELADNDGWALLVKLCESLEEDVLVGQFRLALASEAEHLANVRRWVEQMTLQKGAAA
jgi:hypothetical protein